MAETTSAKLSWVTGLRFEARSASGHEFTMDSPARPGHAGASPMEVFVAAIAACTAMDVVSILEKMRQPLAGLEVEVAGERAEGHPKRLTSLKITYRLRGAGLAREKAERAVELSQLTYCSALASLRPECAVTSAVEIVEA